MTFKTFTVAGCAAAMALTGVTSAFAQQAPAAAARPAAPTVAASAPTVSHGTAITGLCVVSIENAIGASKVGQAVNTRLQQLVAQVNAELNAERTSLDNDAKALDGQRATLDQNTLEQRASALQVRANALQRKAQLRDREIQATEQKALNRVGTEMEPLIRQAYQQKQCAMLINRNSIILGNPASDITQALVTALDGKITQFTFDRERLDQAAPTPAATAPAAATAPRR